MAFGYPVYLDLSDVPVLVVGAGEVGCRKIASLLEAGAAVRVVAPGVHPGLAVDALDSLERRPFAPPDLDGVQLVVAATGVDEVDTAIATEARVRGIWVNAADRPADCTFILPAIARAGDLTVAVSSGGTSPAIASWVRDRIGQEVLTQDVLDVAAEVAEERRRIQERGESTEHHDWRHEIERRLADRTGEQR